MKIKKYISNEIIIIIPMIAGMVAFFLTNKFREGKIINIPKGTHEGGVITAVGVVIIMILVSIITSVILIGIRNRNRNRKIKSIDTH